MLNFDDIDDVETSSGLDEYPDFQFSKQNVKKALQERKKELEAISQLSFGKTSQSSDLLEELKVINCALGLPEESSF